MSSPRDQSIEWGPGKTPRGRARLPSSRRRQRPVVSCSLCRQRKLRCDRQLPCANCTKRALGATCAYNSTTDSSLHDQSHLEGSSAVPQPGTSAQERIKHLETLLLKLMQSQQISLSTRDGGPAAEAPRPKSPGRRSTGMPTPDSTDYDVGGVNTASTGPSYVASSHWAAVLDGIADLKGHFKEVEGQREHRSEYGTSPFPTGPQLFSGCTHSPRKQEILASVPTRPVADQLISCYFNSFEMSPAVLHGVEFLKEYDEFWKDPSRMPTMWVGLLFTILCLATEFQRHQLSPEPNTAETIAKDEELQRTVEHFRQKIVECLVLSDYARGGPYVLETLILYLSVELFLSSDVDMGLCILLGTIVQLAMHMGYHRDPAHFEDMTPFAKEMQRRVWTTVVALDLCVATLMGLPRLIKPSHSDVAEPSNLHDRDFSKLTTELPPSRPETEVTPMLSRLARLRIGAVFGTIWDFSTDTRAHPHADVMRMHQDLLNAHAAIPSSLKWESVALSIADSAQSLMQKVSLEVLVLRSTIILHRRYLAGSFSDADHNESRQTCLVAALKLLEFQDLLQQKTEPFGQLYHERWRVSSIIRTDFLLATSVLCSYLHQAREDEKSDGGHGVSVKAIKEALHKSRDIWLRSNGSSREAQKVVKALDVLLRIDDSGGSSGDASSKHPAASLADTPISSLSVDTHAVNPANLMSDDISWASWPQTEFDAMASLSLPAHEAGLGLGFMGGSMDGIHSNWFI